MKITKHGRGVGAGTRVIAATAAVLTLSLEPADKAYTIAFEPVVGGKPFACGATYAGLGTSKSAVTPQFLRLYVSNVQLIDASGKSVPLKLDQDGTWQQQDVAFLSFEGKNSGCASGSPQDHRAISGRAPMGHYVRLRFTVGVPQRLDHADATIASSPMNLSDMFWSWQDGYKFFRLDARVRTRSGRTAAFVFHLGSTGCSGTGDSARCSQLNTAVVTLRNVDPSRAVAMDVERLLQSVTFETGDGCMMMRGEDCSPELRALGLQGGAQSVFRAK